MVNLHVMERASEKPENAQERKQKGKNLFWVPSPWPGEHLSAREEGSLGEPQRAKLLQGGAISFYAGCYLVE